MEGSTQSSSRTKEIFLADVQQNSRVCGPLHCTYFIQPATQAKEPSPEIAVHAVLEKLNITREMTIHHSSRKKVTVSFPYHKEAIRALKFSDADETILINGHAYKFSTGDDLVHSRVITLSYQAHISIKHVPLHMWKSSIIEQVLSPYCALEYIDKDTRDMADLSAFTCIVRCQKTIAIPDEITVNVPQDRSSSTCAMFVNKYKVLLDKCRYVHGVTKRARYEAKTTTVSANYIVSAAECYISPRMFDADMLQKLHMSVILCPKPGTYFSDIRHIRLFVTDHVKARVSIKMLEDDAFLLYFAEDHPFMCLYAVLSEYMKTWTESGDICLQRWTQDYGSVGGVVTELADLEITGLPCNLCSIPVIEYMLAPFGFVKAHKTIIDDNVAEIGKNIITYKCSVWCIAIQAIPPHIRLKMLPASLTDTAQHSSDDCCRCMVLNVFVHVSPYPENLLPIVNG